MICKIGGVVSRVFERTAPDPFVLAVLLTVVTAGLALVFGSFPDAEGGGSRAVALLDAWRADSGLWRFLAFGMQMCLILVTGHALASSGPVRRLIHGLAGLPRGAGSAGAMVGLVACGFGLINWGLGLIVGALLAREVGVAMEKRGVRVHYPLLAAAGYMGMLVWHGGLSGSAPLTMTSAEGAAKVLPDSVLASYAGGVPLGETLLSPMNLVACGGLLVIVPVMLWLLAPRDGVRGASVYGVGVERAPRASGGSGAEEQSGSPPACAGGSLGASRDGGASLAGASGSSGGGRSVPDVLHETPWLAWVLGLGLIAGVVRFGSVTGLGRIGLNEINAAMLGLGLLLHGSTAGYVRAAEEGAKGCAGVILQFPLYAGIMALLVSSGLIEKFASGLAEFGNETTIPLLTFAGAGVVNLFVPSGGGQWGIQGPIALEAGRAAGIAPGKMIMAVAYGDQLTNMLQPFWALPLLAITGVKAREIVGYTCVVMVVAGVWLAGVLVVF